jgi:hypothetical protein
MGDGSVRVREDSLEERAKRNAIIDAAKQKLQRNGRGGTLSVRGR